MSTDDSLLKAMGVEHYNAAGHQAELAEMGHLSNAVIVPSNLAIVHLTGQVGRVADGSVPGSVADETRAAFVNVQDALEAAGVKAGWKAVYKVRSFHSGVVDEGRLGAYHACIQEFCGENRPAQTAVAVSQILWPGCHLELEVEAAKPAE